MIKLDAKIKRSFWILLSSIAVIVIGGLYLTLSGDSYKDCTLDGTAIKTVLIVTIVLIAILISTIIGLNKKAKKKFNDDTIVFRDPSAVFDFSDPQSVIETIVLYQDYTSQPLAKDIYQNDICNDLIYNMFEKLGWVKLVGTDLYVADSDNIFLKHLCKEPMENALEAISVAEELNLKQYMAKRFKRREETLSEQAFLSGKTATVYHLDKINSYSEEIFNAMYVSAEKIVQDKGVLDYFGGEETYEFREYAFKMAKGCLFFDEALEFAEEKSKEKYFKPETHSTVDSVTIETVFLTIFCMSLILLTGIYFFLPPQDFAIRTLALYLCMLLSIVIGVLGTYTFLLKVEADEALNNEGQEVFNKIQGLKNFICNYTQLKNSSTDNIYRVWDEFVFFACLFGLNSDLYTIAKENGIDYENEQLFDYFKKNDIKTEVFQANRLICFDMPYPGGDKVEKTFVDNFALTRMR